jgi:hypothetical protein
MFGSGVKNVWIGIRDEKKFGSGSGGEKMFRMRIWIKHPWSATLGAMLIIDFKPTGWSGTRSGSALQCQGEEGHWGYNTETEDCWALTGQHTLHDALIEDTTQKLRILEHLAYQYLRGQLHDIFDPRFFHQSTPPRALIHRLKPFRLFLCIRLDNRFKSHQNWFQQCQWPLWNRKLKSRIPQLFLV